MSAMGDVKDPQPEEARADGVSKSDEEGDYFQDAATDDAPLNGIGGFPGSSSGHAETPQERGQQPHAAVASEENAAPAVDREEHALEAKSPLHGQGAPATALDEVSLGETAADTSLERSRSSTSMSKDTLEQSAQHARAPSKLSTKSTSSAWDSLSPLSSSENRAAPATTPVRKLTSPFSWLSRISSKESTPTPKTDLENPGSKTLPNRTSSRHPRRGQSDMVPNRLDSGRRSDGYFDNAQTLSPGNNLRDRFKLQRMKDQAGIDSLDEPGGDAPAHGKPSVTSSADAGTMEADGSSKSNGHVDQREPERRGHFASPSVPVLSSPVDPNLAPGTVAGMATGPSTGDARSNIDWDLWQSLVYEGPTSVAQRSSEELSRAIAGGIPSAIRGVVWQVLADSKNEELEQVFCDLASMSSDPSSRKTPAGSEVASPPPADSVAGFRFEFERPNGQPADAVPRVSRSNSTEHAATPKSDGSGTKTPTPAEGNTEQAAPQLLARLLQQYHLKSSLPDTATLQKLEKVIKRDMGGRTSFSKYAVSAGLQDSLFRVCKAYALFDPGVGYAQGMNFLIMPLLFNMPEEEAFCLFVRLMHHYKLRDMFVPEMPGLHLHLYQFARLLEDLEPALFCHLHRRAVEPTLYATQWFLTLFAYRFPLQLVLRVFDLVLSEGLEGAILRFGVVLMQKNASKLLEMNEMSSLTHYLQERLFDAYIDQAPSANSILESGFFGSSGGSDKAVYRADALVQDACGVKLTAEALKRFSAEWDEKTRTDKERETELENLRSSNASLSGRVRSLEERIEAFDSEHVQVASELVRTKVENEELKEEVESLKVQVEELKSALEKQPQEVEAKLKEEMDRIMQRNIEVQNENRALEEQMSEMEKDLVDTKMQHAEINSSHEALKQKWNDLKKALGD